jgi:hypothetical protein
MAGASIMVAEATTILTAFSGKEMELSRWEAEVRIGVQTTNDPRGFPAAVWRATRERARLALSEFEGLLQSGSWLRAGVDGDDAAEGAPHHEHELLAEPSSPEVAVLRPQRVQVMCTRCTALGYAGTDGLRHVDGTCEGSWTPLAPEQAQGSTPALEERRERERGQVRKLVEAMIQAIRVKLVADQASLRARVRTEMVTFARRDNETWTGALDRYDALFFFFFFPLCPLLVLRVFPWLSLGPVLSLLFSVSRIRSSFLHSHLDCTLP